MDVNFFKEFKIVGKEKIMNMSNFFKKLDFPPFSYWGLRKTVLKYTSKLEERTIVNIDESSTRIPCGSPYNHG
jgi:hypothetical protein